MPMPDFAIGGDPTRPLHHLAAHGVAAAIEHAGRRSRQAIVDDRWHTSGTSNVGEAVRTAARTITRQGAWREEVATGKPLLGPWWVAQKMSVAQARDGWERRREAIRDLTGLEQELVRGLGCPLQVLAIDPHADPASDVDVPVKELAGRSPWDQMPVRRGDSLIPGRIVPLSDAVSDMGVEDIEQRLQCTVTGPMVTRAGTPSTATTLQWGSPGDDDDAVLMFAAVLGLSSFPVQPLAPGMPMFRGAPLSLAVAEEPWELRRFRVQCVGWVPSHDPGVRGWLHTVTPDSGRCVSLGSMRNALRSFVPPFDFAGACSDPVHRAAFTARAREHGWTAHRWPLAIIGDQVTIEGWQPAV